MAQAIVLAGILGLAFGALQLLLMRRVLFTCSGLKRALWLALKIPLWALAFTGMVLWWGIWPLAAFALTAGLLYISVTLFIFFRARRGG